MADDDDSIDPIINSPSALSFPEFLQGTPPGEQREIQVAFVTDRGTFLMWPAIELHCSNASCNGIRFADPSEQADQFYSSGQKDLFVNYRCRNCQKTLKKFALTLAPYGTAGAHAVKVGELPPFGPAIPLGLDGILGDDAALFEKGHRAESQGLGLAAFTYYRRVVENQRTHLFDEILAVAEHIRADAKMIERLRDLRTHWRFQMSVDEIKDCLPQVLLIEGQNPLELLHPVLSDSIHDRSDEEALEIAGEIRLILISLAERIALARTQSEALKSAVLRLMERKEQRGKKIPVGLTSPKQLHLQDSGNPG